MIASTDLQIIANENAGSNNVLALFIRKDLKGILKFVQYPVIRKKSLHKKTCIQSTDLIKANKRLTFDSIF